MAQIKKQMTYPVADEYLSQSMSMGKTATNTYIGPDTIWVPVWKGTADEHDSEGFRHSEGRGHWNRGAIKTNWLRDGDIEDYDNEDQTAVIDSWNHPDFDKDVDHDWRYVKMDCTGEDTHICALFIGAESVDDHQGSYDSLPMVDEFIGDETTPFYSRPDDDHIPPDHVWHPGDCHCEWKEDENGIAYDVTWDLVLHQPWNSWEDIRHNRTNILDATDIKEILPEGVGDKEAWLAYRQELRDLPQKFDGVLPHKVPLPRAPDGSS